jgi:hypothetical protein
MKSLLAGALAILVLAPVASDPSISGNQKAADRVSFSAPQVTCYSQGERVSGMNKICYYDCLGSAYAQTQSAVSLCPLTVRGPGGAGGAQSPRPPAPPVRTTCFARGEQISGMNKICFYDCLGSSHAVTRSATSLCPLTVQQ